MTNSTDKTKFSAFRFMRAIRDHTWPDARTRLRIIGIGDELALHSDGEGCAWPGVERIEARSGVRIRYFGAILDALIAAGFVEVADVGEHHEHVYRLGIGLRGGVESATTAVTLRDVESATTKPRRRGYSSDKPWLQNRRAVVAVRKRKSLDAKGDTPRSAHRTDSKKGEGRAPDAAQPSDETGLIRPDIDPNLPDFDWAEDVARAAAESGHFCDRISSIRKQILKALGRGIAKDAVVSALKKHEKASVLLDSWDVLDALEASTATSTAPDEITVAVIQGQHRRLGDRISPLAEGEATTLVEALMRAGKKADDLRGAVSFLWSSPSSGNGSFAGSVLRVLGLAGDEDVAMSDPAEVHAILSGAFGAPEEQEVEAGAG